MQILLAQPRGFCAGVTRAIDIVSLALQRFGAPVYVYHEIVHNQHVVNDLRDKGAVFVNALDEIPAGMWSSVRAKAKRDGVSIRALILTLLERWLTDEAIAAAVTTPPATTRARMRGAFVKRAKERHRDYAVDWVHLKLNDQAQRTVLCKDPLRSRDERVDRLIESL